MNVGVIVAAGEGRRLGGDVPKQFQRLCGRSIVSYSLSAFEDAREIHAVVLVVDQEWLRFCDVELAVGVGYSKPLTVVAGGATRQESVLLGLRGVSGQARVVAVHDAARPLVSPDHIDELVRACDGSVDGVVPTVRLVDTIKVISPGGVILESADRETLRAAQTPQVFDFHKLLDAHEQGAIKGWRVTDDSQLLEKCGGRIRAVTGDQGNIKVTVGHDLLLAEALLKERALCE